MCAFATLFLIFTASCDRQRDLYVKSTPLLEIEGDWIPSLGRDDMSGRATAMLYPTGGAPHAEFFSKPRQLDAPVGQGQWGVLIFNGMMFSESDTNLEQIAFRNTGALNTFEAVVSATAPLEALSHAEGEYLASVGMEPLTAASAQVDVDGARGYYVKYINGIDAHPDVHNYVDTTFTLTPRLLNYYTQIVVRLSNAGNASSTCSAALRGFAGSAFMASGQRGAQRVTHQVRLTKLMVDPSTDMGSVESAPFLTFGPPLEQGLRFELEVNVVGRDGAATTRTFDVTNQVEPVVERLNNGTFTNSKTAPILIDVRLDLPELEAGVELDPWGDGDNIVIVVN